MHVGWFESEAAMPATKVSRRRRSTGRTMTSDGMVWGRGVGYTPVD